MSRILITGATGRLGSNAADALLGASSEHLVTALVRSPERTALLPPVVEPRYGDYADSATLRAALSGVERLLFVSSPQLHPEARLAHHRAVIEAAEAEGVEYVVYTSAFGAEHDPAHSWTESALAERFPHATVLRNAFYTEPFVRRAIEESRTGWITSASGGGALATASVRDLGAAAALAVAGTPRSSVLELRGAAWRYDELAARLAEAGVARALRHREVDAADTGAFAPLFRLAAAGRLAGESPDLAALLGRAPRTIGEVVSELV